MIILKLVGRYAFSKTNRHRNVVLLIMLAIAIGSFALIVMLSLMNNLQSGILNQIKALESFHIQLSPFEPEIDEITSLKEVESSFAFITTQSLLQAPSSNCSKIMRLRFLDPKIFATQNPFISQLEILEGSIPQNGEILISSYNSSSLGLKVGDEVNLTLLASGKTTALAPFNTTAKISGIFKSDLFEFDQTTSIGNFNYYRVFFDTKRISYGLFLTDKGLKRINALEKKILAINRDTTVTSWQKANSAFYSALMLEKVLMYLFLFFMFLILAINMRNASFRLLYAKMRELAILRSLGFYKKNVLKLFLGQGALVTVIGEIIGIGGALLVKNNINSIFVFFNNVQKIFTHRNNILLLFPFKMEIGFNEIIFIFFSILILSLFFTYLGVRELVKKEPLETLYHE